MTWSSCYMHNMYFSFMFGFPQCSFGNWSLVSFICHISYYVCSINKKYSYLWIMSHYRMFNSFLEVSRMLISFTFLKEDKLEYFELSLFFDSGLFFVFFFWKFYNLGKSKRKAKYPFTYHIIQHFSLKNVLIIFIEV